MGGIVHPGSMGGIVHPEYTVGRYTLRYTVERYTLGRTVITLRREPLFLRGTVDNSAQRASQSPFRHPIVDKCG